MALVAGTIDGVTLLKSSGASKVYEVLCSFGAYTGASDSATVLGIAAAINAATRNGKVAAMVAGEPPTRGGPGYDTNGQAVYAGTMVLAGTGSITDVTMNLTDSAQVELTTSTACSGVSLIVQVLEA